MRPLLNTSDLGPMLRVADRAATRLCRNNRIFWVDPDDVRQDLILDLLMRLPQYDPDRGSLSSFASLCIQHKSLQLHARYGRERIGQHPLSLDAPIPGVDELTLADTLSNDDSYGAWIGQPVDPFAQVENRLDLDRALAALPADAIPVCAALMRDEPDPASVAGLARTTMHRRVRELRYQLLAAGIGGSRGTDRAVAG